MVLTPTVLGPLGFGVSVNAPVPDPTPLDNEATAQAAATLTPTVTVEASPGSSTPGGPAAFTVTVATPAGDPTATGAVTIVLDGVSQGSPVAVNGGGKATLTLPPLGPGPHRLVATYSGDARYDPASSSPIGLDVGSPTPTPTPTPTPKPTLSQAPKQLPGRFRRLGPDQPGGLPARLRRLRLPALRRRARRRSSPSASPGPARPSPPPPTTPAPATTEVAAYLPAYGAFAIRPAGGGPDLIVPFGIPGAGQIDPRPGRLRGDRPGRHRRLPARPRAPSRSGPGRRPRPDHPLRHRRAGPVDPGARRLRRRRPGRPGGLPAGLRRLRRSGPPAAGPTRSSPSASPGAGQSIPVPGDYDGSGRTELAVYFPALGVFAYRPAGGGPDVIVAFGAGRRRDDPGAGRLRRLGPHRDRRLRPELRRLRLPAGRRRPRRDRRLRLGRAGPVAAARRPRARYSPARPPLRRPGGPMVQAVALPAVPSTEVAASLPAALAPGPRVTRASATPAGPALVARRALRVPIARASHAPTKTRP